jgi:hypothetical protein
MKKFFYWAAPILVVLILAACHLQSEPVVSGGNTQEPVVAETTEAPPISESTQTPTATS